MTKKKKRPAIPLHTQLKLWTLAAGRCEFLGCNKFLLRDDLTLSEGNYSNIAHIIAWTPAGPRGDKTLSQKLARDISNLMLVCQKHAKLIDDQEQRYPVQLLRIYKEKHETRIRIQTDIQQERKTTVLRFQSNIRGRKVEIPIADVYEALIAENRYPADERGILIDLTNFDYSTGESFWDAASRQTTTVIQRELSTGHSTSKPNHLSLFALAPIPLLVHLGFSIGNVIPADIYLRTRKSGGRWSLCDHGSNANPVQLTVRRNNIESDSKTVILSVSLSGTTPSAVMATLIGGSNPFYEITTANPNVDILSSQADIEEFRKAYRDLLTEIRERHGKAIEIHLFAAVPSPVAIICGRELIHGVDPPLVVYEHRNQDQEFFPALKVV